MTINFDLHNLYSVVRIHIGRVRILRWVENREFEVLLGDLGWWFGLHETFPDLRINVIFNYLFLQVQTFNLLNTDLKHECRPHWGPRTFQREQRWNSFKLPQLSGIG